MTSNFSELKDRQVKQYVTGEAQNVFLPSVPAGSSDERNQYQPQTLKVRSNDNNIFLISSKDKFNKASPNSNFNATLDYFENVKKIKPKYYHIDWNIPNVNKFNNTFSIIEGNGLTTHSVTIPVGLYTTPVTLGQAMATGLNALAIPATTWGINLIAPPALPNTFTMDVVGNTFQFIDSQMARDGQGLVSFPLDTPLSTSVPSNPANLIYTRYVSVISKQLTSTSRSFNEFTSDHGRSVLDIIPMDDIKNTSVGTISGKFENEVIINVLENTAFNIDIELRDEFYNLISEIMPEGDSFYMILSGER